MLNILHPVDGSDNVVRATRKLIDTLGWYKEAPAIELLAVLLPVHRFPNMGIVVSDEMIERYYADEAQEMLAPSQIVLEAAGVAYTSRQKVGAIAESIVAQAELSRSDMICLGSRGRTGLANMVLGSVSSRVLHLAHIPVVLIR